MAGIQPDQLVKRYDAWYETPFGRYADRLEKNLFLKLLPEGDRKLTLDVGCGTGNYSTMFAKGGAWVVGVDILLSMIILAKRQSKKLRLNVEVVLADASMLPFRTGVFDLAVSVLTLCFVRVPRNVVEEMRRVTKQNGELVVGTLNRWSLYGISKKVKSLFIETSYRSAIFNSPVELKWLTGSPKWYSTLFALEWMPKLMLQILYRFDAQLGRIFKPFGAFLAAKTVSSNATCQQV